MPLSQKKSLMISHVGPKRGRTFFFRGSTELCWKAHQNGDHLQGRGIEDKGSQKKSQEVIKEENDSAAQFQVALKFLIPI